MVTGVKHKQFLKEDLECRRHPQILGSKGTSFLSIFPPWSKVQKNYFSSRLTGWALSFLSQKL